MDVCRLWTSFNIYKGVDVGGDNVPIFPNQEEQENYEQLYGTNNDGNYNTEHDHVGFDLGDAGHHDVDDNGLDDNDNVIHGRSLEVHELAYEVASFRAGCSSSQMVTSSFHRRRVMDTVDPRFLGCESIVVGQIFNNKIDLIKRLSVHCMKENKRI